MKRISIFQCYALALLMVTPFISCEDAIEQENQRYVFLDDSISNIGKVITQISRFDENLNSPLHLLRRYCEDGNVLALRDEVEMVLGYADSFLRQHEDVIQKNVALCEQFEDIVNQFLNGELDITEDLIKSSPHLRLLTVNERMLVKGKTIFKNVVIMDKELRVHGKARFYENVKFKKNVTIDGSLSLQDEVIGCDLTVGCNINMNNSTSAAVGNINKDGQPFIHNFGTSNTFVGVDAGNFTMTGIDNSGFGAGALLNDTSGTANTAVGASALYNNTTGEANVAVGIIALASNTTGNVNTAVGASALLLNTTGNANTAVGVAALESNTTGNVNTAVGAGVLFNNTTGNGNTGVGVFALGSNTTGNGNTAVGASAMQANTTGENNTAVGSDSLQSNTTGIDNTALGTSALAENITGTDNTAVGVDALVNNVTGNQNTAVGAGTGSNLVFTGGSNNTFIGYQAGVDLTGGGNNLYLGSNSGFTGAESNTTRIGNGSTAAAFMSGVYGVGVGATNSPVIIDNNGQLGTTVSSAAFKRNIENMGIKSERIYGLNPVSFMYKKDATNTLQYGLIAEEVAQVFPELVVYDAEGKPFTVRYELLAVLLLNELKKLSAEVAVLKTRSCKC